MSFPITGDAKVGLALDVFRHFETQPGAGLPSNVLVVAAVRAGKTPLDLRAGIDIGARRRWFTVGPDGFVTLTDLGHDQL